MRVLVTGAAGFVGRAFGRHAREARWDWTGVDNYVFAHDDCRRWFADGQNSEPGRYDLVIHCAAVVGGRATIDGEPLRLMAEDLSIDAALFRWALRARPRRIVYFSSAAMYPAKMQQPSGWCIQTGLRLDEGTEQFAAGPPDATYGLVKLVGERLAAEANAAGIKTHVFRPFSGYGTDQHLDYPFPRFIRRALDREDPFEIWGSGDSARDWIHIDDIVGAVLAAIDQDVLGPVNICTGRATTFDQLAEMVMARSGHRSDVKHVGDAPQGVHWRVGDPTKLHEFYRPKVTLEEGIARAIKGRL